MHVTVNTVTLDSLHLPDPTSPTHSQHMLAHDQLHMGSQGHMAPWINVDPLTPIGSRLRDTGSANLPLGQREPQDLTADPTGDRAGLHQEPLIPKS